MHPRHWIDIGPAQLAYGCAACWSRRDPEAEAASLLAACGLADRGLASLAVRSAWDLLLSVVDWPAGSEVIVSAVGHPDMVALIEWHGYVAVPVDIDLETLLPLPDALATAVSERTRAVLIVQLFGGRGDLGAVAAFARAHDLLLVEDAAQAFAGVDSFAPDATPADVTLVSFGMIKTATAGGGALTVVNDPALLERMRTVQAGWPVQPTLQYAGRLFRLAAMLVLGRPALLGAVFRVCRWRSIDPDRWVGAIGRSYGGDRDRILAALRRRPSAPLLALLRRRVERFDRDRLARRARAGESLAAALPPAVDHPGRRQGRRTHWIFPVVVSAPVDLVARLRTVGVDAASATSNLATAGGHTPQASALLAGVVYLPAYPELPASVRAQLRSALAASTAATSRSASPS